MKELLCYQTGGCGFTVKSGEATGLTGRNFVPQFLVASVGNQMLYQFDECGVVKTHPFRCGLELELLDVIPRYHAVVALATSKFGKLVIIVYDYEKKLTNTELDFDTDDYHHEWWISGWRLHPKSTCASNKTYVVSVDNYGVVDVKECSVGFFYAPSCTDLNLGTNIHRYNDGEYRLSIGNISINSNDPFNAILGRVDSGLSDTLCKDHIFTTSGVVLDYHLLPYRFINADGEEISDKLVAVKDELLLGSSGNIYRYSLV